MFMSKDFEHLGKPHAYWYTGFGKEWESKRKKKLCKK